MRARSLDLCAQEMRVKALGARGVAVFPCLYAIPGVSLTGIAIRTGKLLHPRSPSFCAKRNAVVWCYAGRHNDVPHKPVVAPSAGACCTLGDIPAEAGLALRCEPWKVGRDMPVGLL